MNNDINILEILAKENPSQILLELDKQNILVEILPELTALKGQTFINGNGHKDNFYHSLEVLDNVCVCSNNIWIRFLAILHDIGKAPTKRYDENIGWTFHRHEEVGSAMIKPIFNRFGIVDIDIKYMEKLMELNGQIKNITDGSNTDSSIRRFITNCTNIDMVFDLCLFAKCDITTKYSDKKKRFVTEIEDLEIRIKSIIESDNLAKYRPPINGQDIMDILEIGTGREVGTVMKLILDAIKSNDLKEDRFECLEFIRKYKENKK